MKHPLNHLFKYHAPSKEQLPKYEAIRNAAKEFATVILANTPEGADQDECIRKIRETCMTANAAVALNVPISE